MKTSTKHFFSLLELCIAIAVLAVGAIAVVTMMPTGIKENRDAVGNNYSSIFADDMHSYISKKVSENWSFLQNLPSTNSSVVLSAQTSDWSNLLGDIYMPSNVASGSGVYGIKLHSGNSATPDFVAQANVWQSDVSNINLVGSYGNAQNAGNAIITENSNSSQTVSLSSTVNSYTISSVTIGINPNNSKWSFELIKTDGSTFTRNDMQNNKKNDAYNSPGVAMSATYIKMRMKGGGPYITVGSSVVNLQGKNVTFSAPPNDPMQVIVWKENSGMGQWYIQLTGGSSTTISADDGSAIVGLPAIPTTTSNPALPSSEANNSLTNGDLAKGINVEISWPLDASYAQRTKLKYYFEVYNKALIAP